ncbi:aminoglycoside phosphotransferase APH(3') [Bifidobacterium eulemuris]|uniref:Aminoglycoside phosphotransferase APH(3') n=3 Tax=Bifidobacterium eulemuris TaxID=1765219 RepID=A0A261GCG4_9BIFI|nr:aminoglycoside phosphotransferase APH(3') [Bifidobacterium eulemuris]
MLENMKRTSLQRPVLPHWLDDSLAHAPMFDSSSSPEARVTFIDHEDGFFLKRAKLGTLQREAELTRFFHERGLAAETLRYDQDPRHSCDWLLTKRLPGEDCTASQYMEQPERLADLMAERLAALHTMPTDGCPVPDHTTRYLERAKEGRRIGRVDPSFFTDMFGPASLSEIHRVIVERKHLLHTDTLLHGDYCLPNIILDDWRFSGFMDLDSGGVGDRHVDVFWALWTLRFNLHTDRYDNRFLDAYGRERVDFDVLPLIAAIEVFG